MGNEEKYNKDTILNYPLPFPAKGDIIYIYNFLFSKTFEYTNKSNKEFNEWIKNLKNDFNSDYEIKDIRFHPEQEFDSYYRFSRLLLLQIPRLEFSINAPMKINWSSWIPPDYNKKKDLEKLLKIFNVESATFCLYETGIGSLYIKISLQHIFDEARKENNAKYEELINNKNNLLHNFLVELLSPSKELAGKAFVLINDLKEKLNKFYKEQYKRDHEEIKWIEFEDKTEGNYPSPLVSPKHKLMKDKYFAWQIPGVIFVLYDIASNQYKSIKYDHWIANLLLKNIFPPLETSYIEKYLDFSKIEQKIINMSYPSDYMFAHLSSELFLLIFSVNELKEVENHTIIRFKDQFEQARIQWYILTITNWELDQIIQNLRRTRKYLEVTSKREKTNKVERVNKIIDFMEDWIGKRIRFLRTFEDPSFPRTTGASSKVIYDKSKEIFFLDRLKEVVLCKIQLIDKMYENIIDLERLKDYKSSILEE